jgi:hypothetical protein
MTWVFPSLTFMFQRWHHDPTAVRPRWSLFNTRRSCFSVAYTQVSSANRARRIPGTAGAPPPHLKVKKSQSYIETDGQSISKSWCRAPSGANDQIFITLWQLWSVFLVALSLTRGRVCLLYMLLALASVVFLGSESFQNRDHILLSQIWDFPFRRLLRLAGSRWRYSNPPPHGVVILKYNFRSAPTENTVF